MEKTSETPSMSDNIVMITTNISDAVGKVPESVFRVVESTSETYPPTREVIPILCALATANLLVSLDRNIIATVIPKISDEFHSISDIGWYASAYMLTASAFMLLFGKIYTFYSPKWVLLIAIFLFEVGSAVCGSAPNSTAFIVGRAIAGWGNSGIVTGAIVTIQHILPLQKRPRVMGMMGAIFGISSVAGPLIGGALASRASWRWCFYLNLPIGGTSMLVLFLLLKVHAPAKAGTTFKTQLAQLDPFGTVCFLPSIVCLILALQRGGSQYTWHSPRIIALLILFGVLMTFFIAIQIWKGEKATVPPHVFKQRSVFSGFAFCFLNGAALSIMVYYLPIYFQAIKSVDALHSGFAILPFLLSIFFGSLIAGFTVSKLGYYVPHMLFGPVLTSIGAGLLTTLSPSTTTAQWIGYQILFGFGVGIGLQQPAVAAQTVLSKKDIGIGASLMMFAMQISGAVFVPVGQNVFENQLLGNLQGQGVDGRLLLDLGATEIRGAFSTRELEGILNAYNEAFRKVLVVALIMTALAILPALGMEWRSVKKNPKRIKVHNAPSSTGKQKE